MRSISRSRSGRHDGATTSTLRPVHPATSQPSPRRSAIALAGATSIAEDQLDALRTQDERPALRRAPDVDGAGRDAHRRPTGASARRRSLPHPEPSPDRRRARTAPTPPLRRCCRAARARDADRGRSTPTRARRALSSAPTSLAAPPMTPASACASERVGDHEILGVERALLAVERRELLARPCAPHDDPLLGELVEVERVQRLSGQQQHVVRRVDEVAERTQPACRSGAPARAPATVPNDDAFDHAREVPRTSVEILDRRPTSASTHRALLDDVAVRDAELLAVQTARPRARSRAPTSGRDGSDRSRTRARRRPRPSIARRRRRLGVFGRGRGSLRARRRRRARARSTTSPATRTCPGHLPRADRNVQRRDRAPTFATGTLSPAVEVLRAGEDRAPSPLPASTCAMHELVRLGDVRNLEHADRRRRPRPRRERSTLSTAEPVMRQALGELLTPTRRCRRARAATAAEPSSCTGSPRNCSRKRWSPSRNRRMSSIAEALHRDPLDAHAEGEAGVPLRVDADERRRRSGRPCRTRPRRAIRARSGCSPRRRRPGHVTCSSADGSVNG